MRLGILVAMALAVPGVVPDPITAQVPSIEDRRLEYRAALESWEAAVAAWLVLEERWRQANDTLARARSTADASTLDRLQSLALQRSRELLEADLRVAETLQRLDAAREALRAALDRQLEALGREFDAATSPARRDSLSIRIEDLRNQFLELADPDPEELSPTREVLPALNYDPRDRPSDLRNKAELADRQAERYEELIEETAQELDRRREFLRIQRLAGDARSSLDRFGDPQVPVTSGGGERSAGGLPQDTVGIELDALPPEEAIRILETRLLQLQNFRDEMRRRAALFRDLIRAEVRQ